MAEPAKITDLNLETEFADSDMFPFSDVSSGLDKRISGADLRKNVSADIENVTALKLFEGTRDGQIVWLNGHGEEGDGGEGVVRWDASSTETANDGTIFQVTGVTTGRWKRLVTGKELNVAAFGMFSGQDISATLVTAINACMDIGVDTLNFNKTATYNISATTSAIAALISDGDRFTLNGNGCTLNQTESLDYVFQFESFDFVGVYDFNYTTTNLGNTLCRYRNVESGIIQGNVLDGAKLCQLRSLPESSSDDEITENIVIQLNTTTGGGDSNGLVDIRETKNIEIRKNSFKNIGRDSANADGVKTQGTLNFSYRIDIHHNVFDGATDDAIDTYNAGIEMYIYKNEFKNQTSGKCINIKRDGNVDEEFSVVEKVWVYKNEFKNNTWPISMNGAENVWICENDFIDNEPESAGGNAIIDLLRSANRFYNNVNIEKNVFRGNTDYRACVTVRNGVLPVFVGINSNEFRDNINVTAGVLDIQSTTGDDQSLYEIKRNKFYDFRADIGTDEIRSLLVQIDNDRVLLSENHTDGYYRGYTVPTTSSDSVVKMIQNEALNIINTDATFSGSGELFQHLNSWNLPISGATGSRPTVLRYIGQEYFDTTLGHVIHWDGTNWVDSSGTTV